ncbi:MAG: protein-L-isoaspartate(D-aspartate) O-methyltransferase [Paracoccaceae bacterium]|jgi:protein-L-isoaspartate(D-aspartate) O-methyltransferase
MIDFQSRRTMMVDTQVRPSDVTKFPIIDAMLRVPREIYVPRAMRDVAYVGENVELGGGRVILDPRVLAKMLNALDVQPDEMVLDIGCGLGYSTAVLARLAEAVVAVEADAEMAADAETLLSGQAVDNAAVIGGALAAGCAKHGPFDAITIQGGIEILPQAIADQVNEGGRIAAIFMQGALGECRIGQKFNDRIVWRMAFNATAPVLAGFEKSSKFVL